MKFFITGGSGLLGERLATIASNDDEIVLSHNSNPTKNTIKCDITDKNEVEKKRVQIAEERIEKIEYIIEKVEEHE